MPLDDGTHALGVAARRDRRGDITLGYFFGPRREGEPAVPDEGLRADDAVLVRRVFPHGFDDGSWKVLGPLPDWARTEWPMPELIRGPDTEGMFWRERYDDDDPSQHVAVEPASQREVQALPEEAISGDRALVVKLELELPKVTS